MSNNRNRRRNTPNHVPTTPTASSTPTSERVTPPSRPSPPLDAEERKALIERDADEVMGHLNDFVARGTAAQRAVDAKTSRPRGPLSVGGKPTMPTRELMISLSMQLRAMVDGMPHLDNTGARCRVDLDGHDACDTCNQVGGALRAVIEESW